MYRVGSVTIKCLLWDNRAALSPTRPQNTPRVWLIVFRVCSLLFRVRGVIWVVRPVHKWALPCTSKARQRHLAPGRVKAAYRPARGGVINMGVHSLQVILPYLSMGIKNCPMPLHMMFISIGMPISCLMSWHPPWAYQPLKLLNPVISALKFPLSLAIVTVSATRMLLLIVREHHLMASSSRASQERPWGVHP